MNRQPAPLQGPGAYDYVDWPGQTRKEFYHYNRDKYNEHLKYELESLGRMMGIKHWRCPKCMKDTTDEEHATHPPHNCYGMCGIPGA